MFRSPYPDLEIPDVSIHEYLFTGLDEAALDRVAIVDGMSGAETTYRQLIGQIDLFAGALAARGIGVGSVIGVLCPNIPAFAIVFHGILRAGATATTINSLYTAEEIGNQLEDAGAEWLITVSPMLAGAMAAAERRGIPAEQVIVLDGAEGHPNLRDLLGEGNAAPEVAFDPATHIAVLPYSSGTTGRPKGVMLTHRNLVANVAQVRGVLDVTQDDALLAVLPFFHIYGMTVLLNFAMSRGARLVTMPKFDLVEFLRIIQEHRTTWVFVAPPIAVALAKHPIVDQYDLSSVKVIFSGAAPLDGALSAAVEKRLGCEVQQGYGMTETSPAAMVIPSGRRDVDRASIGPLVPNTEARLVDVESGADIEPPAEGSSAPGELWLRGPQIMAGYLNRPDATAEMIDADGWLHTGDIATVDTDAIFHIVDRLKELIKYKGYQVAPAVLEALLLEHPQIADAAVIGANDEDGQEVPKAFIVLQQDADLDAAGVMEFVASRVAPHEKVRMVEFIDVIPKSSAGKILRKDLRARV
ncbi:4-coumarate--CoA ligase family protein [Microbacterium bovistercoris]|uniref:4-coumarate--CoA ligase family protein n=1 Tax=Microbacterium bovistercoris TaxID=2293570 RepID=A0A371NTV8_9MICO|nr:AMP-binding protein [Microbacterium bovistercoris]REJ05833.1 4-coumarate--CoA ligase family protein [Microbacterium bovistercoris]